MPPLGFHHGVLSIVIDYDLAVDRQNRTIIRFNTKLILTN
jgi:hypothetical protein